jgi:UPF0755 protein
MGGRHAVRGSGRIRALIVLLVLFGVLAGGAGGFYLWATGASGPSAPVSLTIAEGANASDVAELLAEKGVVRSALAFRLVAQLRGSGSVIQAGTYDLQTNMRAEDALQALSAGPRPAETLSVTIPEGLRVDQIAERVAEVFAIDRKRFIRLAESGDFVLPPYLPEKADTVEGFLFPKTYEFTPDSDAEGLIEGLLGQFEKEVTSLGWERAGQLGVKPYEVVIIASLIEREARVPEDRAKIASVIYNRLERGMRLQIDATVEYALPEHKARLTYEDYRYESPYNTYLHDGLPPTPIASPGLASMEAALNPADTDFLFYLVVDEAGRHAFTESYDEFLRLKAEVQGG